MSWVPTTENERSAMLETIGVSSIDDLFDTIPETLRIDSLGIPDGLSEMSVHRHLSELAAANHVDRVSFLGGGYYDHYIPAAVDALSGRMGCGFRRRRHIRVFPSDERDIIRRSASSRIPSFITHSLTR